ncbi:ATP-binding protein [Lysinibacillus sp. BW-2-10]|uniref:sensor histidine kinase n=1 Tax=Lysinibacillus sp. BW-2-10 TaxID=2590030 RepID=UPI00117C4CE7|nr:ATP-binding protein [Lysinibacillus sp. BW-2-10]TSI10117.1 GAF domain-containing protein [Lysinibacillus sp. BW-2-10]
MVLKERESLIGKLTGIQSSKKSYYSELKVTVEELKKKNMQLEVINEVTQSLNIEMSIDEMLKNIFEKIKPFIAIERMSLSLYENNQLVLSNVFPLDSFYFPMGYVFEKEKSLYWQSILTLEKVLFKMENHTPIYIEEKAYQSLGIQSILIIPLVSKKAVIGVLSIGRKELNHFSEDDLSFLQQLSDQIAVCFENVQLYHKVLNSKKEWEETFRAVSDMIFITDTNGIILKCNTSAINFFDTSIIGQDLQTVLDLPRTNNYFLSSISIEENFYQEFHFNHHLFELRAYPIYNNIQQVYSFIIYIIDITEKRKMEAQLIQSGKLAAIGEIAAGIAHELNNPLTAILGNSQLLLRDAKSDDRSHKLLSGIYTCGKRSKNIIQNLLTFSRQDEYSFDEFSINDAVEQVLEIIGDQFKKQNITIEKQLQLNINNVYGNIQQIGQIILNLLINAKDALEEKNTPKKIISIETKEFYDKAKKWVVLTIKDNGNGIQPHQLQDIFNPFFTTKEPGKGTGLGLSVSLGIAEKHNGLIEVDSKYKEGSEFSLKLPIKFQ